MQQPEGTKGSFQHLAGEYLGKLAIHQFNLQTLPVFSVQLPEMNVCDWDQQPN